MTPKESGKSLGNRFEFLSRRRKNREGEKMPSDPTAREILQADARAAIVGAYLITESSLANSFQNMVVARTTHNLHPDTTLIETLDSLSNYFVLSQQTIRDSAVDQICSIASITGEEQIKEVKREALLGTRRYWEEELRETLSQDFIKFGRSRIEEINSVLKALEDPENQ